MKKLTELRADVREKFSALEKASEAIQAGDPADENTDVEALEAAFGEAERAHKTSVDVLERAERLEEARASLPVAPVEVDEPAEERSEVRVTKNEPTYRADNMGASFFHDVGKGNSEARERLARNHREVADQRTEVRTSTGLNSTDTSGGEWVPPIWLLDEYVKTARASAPLITVLKQRPLPPGQDSINLPKFTSGTATTEHTELATVTPTDPVTSSVTAPVVTEIGAQLIARQTFERSAEAGTGIGDVIVEDLLGELARKVDVQALAGAGSGAEALGLTNVSSPNTITYTTASPVVTGSATAADNLYPKLANAIQLVHSNRYAAATCIIVHPRRWGWIMAAADTVGRPIVNPVASAYNVAGIGDLSTNAGFAGSILGVPVLLDANVTTTDSSTRDKIIVTRLEDLYFWAKTPVVRVFDETDADKNAVRVQVDQYFAFAPHRYAKSTTLITGSGLTTPTF